MKDYLWVIVTGVFSLVSFLLFILTINSSTSLIKRLRRSKWNLLLNITLLLIGISNLGIAMFLLLNVREQIEKFSNF